MRTIILRSGDDLKRLRRRLKDPRPLLKAIGALMESQAQAAFRNQKLGTFRWPERYPNQEDPFVNVAGVVQDFTAAPSRQQPLSRRFQRRPALMDTGALAGSISSRIRTGNVVETGSTLPYAADHQWGLTSSQAVPEAARKGIRRWLDSDRGKPYKLKLWHLTTSEELTTQVNQRPFLGITSRLEQDIAATVELFVAEGDA